jgi:uncharacterized protein (DUF1330 family)
MTQSGHRPHPQYGGSDILVNTLDPLILIIAPATGHADLRRCHPAKKEETMKAPHVIGLSMLAGVALGATAIQGLHAQAKPPVYVIVAFSEITDPAGYAALGGRTVAGAASVMKDFGGHFLARTESITALDGTPPNIINAFDNAEKAQAWYNSPEQKQANEIRSKTTKSRAFMVEGM